MSKTESLAKNITLTGWNFKQAIKKSEEKVYMNLRCYPM